MLVQLPDSVYRAIGRKMKEWDWPETVPAYACFPNRPGKCSIWKAYEDLTVGDCTQLIEYHTRLANRLLEKCWQGVGCKSTPLSAAEHILRTWVYHALYVTLTNQQDLPADEFPFPLLTMAEAQRKNNEQ